MSEFLKKIDVGEVFSKMNSPSSDFILIDVRTPSEYNSIHIKGIQNFPLNHLEKESPNLDKSQKTVIFCQSGKRAEMAGLLLQKYGFKDLEIVEGGVNAWKSSGYETIEGKGVISLERQVRIAAGGLVALGTALGFLVNPYFYILPGFVGCGLVFAGITDTCAMGMLILKLPWNNSRSCCEK